MNGAHLYSPRRNSLLSLTGSPAVSQGCPPDLSRWLAASYRLARRSLDGAPGVGLVVSRSMESWFLLSQVSKAIVCGGTHFTFPGLGPSAWGRVRETRVLRLRRAAPDPLRMAEVGLGSRSPTQARLGRARRACTGEDARTTAGKDAGAPIGAGTPGSGSVRIEKSNRRSCAYRASRYFAPDDSAEGGFVPSPRAELGRGTRRAGHRLSPVPKCE